MKPNRIPPELLRSTPRDVRLKAGGFMLAGLAVTLVAGAVASAVGLTALARQGAARRAQALREGVPAVAEVTELGRVKEGKRTIRYRYVAGGGVLEDSAQLRRREWQSIRTGMQVPIRYLPSDPEQSWMPGHEPGGLPFAIPPIVTACCLAGAGAVWYGIRTQRHLLEMGRPALATVTGVKRGQHGYEVKYEFTTLSGGRRTGSYTSGRKVEPGTAAVILHDPDNPRRAARYPLSLWRIV